MTSPTAWGLTGQAFRRVAAATGIITTYAGDGSFGRVSADGVVATAARIGHPAGMFVDGAGLLSFLTVQLFGGDVNALKRVDAGGKLATVAGAKPYGNLASPTTMSLYRPSGVAVDAVGNLYVSDQEHDRIWKIPAGGAPVPYAGTGLRNSSGDGGPAINADIVAPEGLWWDATAGALYFAEISSPSRIRRIDASGIIATVAGGGSTPAGCPLVPPTSPPIGAGSGYNCWGDDYFANLAVIVYPRSIAGDGKGNLYISEFDPTVGNRIRRVDFTTGRITTIAGSTATSGTWGFAGDGGPATQAKLFAPAGMAISPAGDLVFADTYNKRIRRVNLVSNPIGNILTLYGNGTVGTTGNGGPAAAATFREPFGLAYDAQGNLYVGDAVGHTVRRIDTSGFINRFAGAEVEGFAGDSAAARDAFLYYPNHLAVSADGQSVYIADGWNDRIRRAGP